MPQFDFSTYTSQILWMLVSFFAIYVFVSRFVAPKINLILQKRSDLAIEYKKKTNDLFEKVELLRNQQKLLEQDIAFSKEQIKNQLSQKIDDFLQKSDLELEVKIRKLEEEQKIQEKQIFHNFSNLKSNLVEDVVKEMLQSVFSDIKLDSSVISKKNGIQK